MASRASSKGITDTDKGFDALMDRVRRVGSGAASIEVGITEGSGAAAHRDAGGLTVLDIATFHEFGLGFNPERSFIRGWFDAYQAVAKDYIAKILASVVAGKRTTEEGLNLLGVRFVGECQRYMTNTPAHWEPLRPATIRAKGSSKPLIDTGQLRSSITYRISFGGSEPP